MDMALLGHRTDGIQASVRQSTFFTNIQLTCSSVQPDGIVIGSSLLLDLWQRETEDSPMKLIMELIFLLTCTVLLCEAYGPDIRNEKERVNLCSLAQYVVLLSQLHCLQSNAGLLSNVVYPYKSRYNFLVKLRVHVRSVTCCTDFCRDLCCKF